MKDQRLFVVESALDLAIKTGCEKVFLFTSTPSECRWFIKCGIIEKDLIVIVIPTYLTLTGNEAIPECATVLKSWSGNQSRFSRIKYAFMNGVLHGIIRPDSKVVCVLGPYGRCHLDTITIHDLAHSWSEEFPFEVQPLMENKAFHTIMAVVDIALDIGALGREGKPLGTAFVIGDTENVIRSSHQTVFNPFKGYDRDERMITRPEVVESIKELSKLDGAIVISDDGVVEAAGRHLDVSGHISKSLRGLGARHRSAAGITRITDAVAIVVSESTGRVSIFNKGRIIATLEPLISRRLV
jgi:hypothetical protein